MGIKENCEVKGMYHINGVVGLKVLNDGSIARRETGIKYHLNTEKGVIRFITEYNPWVTVTIKQDQTDVTAKFKEHIIMCGSRTNRQPKVSKYVGEEHGKT